MQDGLLAGFRHFVNHSPANITNREAAIYGRIKEVARLVSKQVAPLGLSSIRTALKGVEHGLLTRRIELVDDATAVKQTTSADVASCFGRTV